MRGSMYKTAVYALNDLLSGFLWEVRPVFRTFLTNAIGTKPNSFHQRLWSRQLYRVILQFNDRTYTPSTGVPAISMSWWSVSASSSGSPSSISFRLYMITSVPFNQNTKGSIKNMPFAKDQYQCSFWMNEHDKDDELTTAALYFVELLHQLLLVFKRWVFEDELCLYCILLRIRSQRLLGFQIPGGERYDHLRWEHQQA